MSIDEKEILERLREDYKKVTAPDSGLPQLSHIAVMLKFFTAPILLR